MSVRWSTMVTTRGSVLVLLLASSAIAFRPRVNLGRAPAPCSYSRATRGSGIRLLSETDAVERWHDRRVTVGTSTTLGAADELAPSTRLANPAVALSRSLTSAASFAKVLWRFTRPHTFIGTALCIPALHIFAAPPGTPIFTPKMLYSILWALIPAGFINVYITGLNQVTDVKIDKINKPYLPIAAGDLSKQAATVVVLLSLAAGLGLGLLQGPFASSALKAVLVASAALGTVYSVPPFRLKRFPVLAAFCIIAVRGSIVNMGFYGHALQAAFRGAGPLALLLQDVKCMAATAFFAVFGAIIAFMKDVPDVKGDAINNIRSFSVRAGAERMFKICTALTWTLFMGASVGMLGAARHAMVQAGAGLLSWTVLARSAVAVMAAWAGATLRNKAREVDPHDGQQVYTYYMFLWKLFYCSYLALPLAR